MKNSEYWKERFLQIENSSHKNAQTVLTDIEEQYIVAQRKIEADIEKWYRRFANNNEITMHEAKKLLNSKEVAEFKWDIKDYIKNAQGNEISDSLMKQLENASARHHITKLEALKFQTQLTGERLFGNQTDAIDKFIKRNYLDTYYHAAYEVQKGFNIGWDVAAIDERRLKAIIFKPWTTDGKNFSERIWSNKTKLINELQTQLTQDIILGRSPQESIKAIAKKFSTSKSNAGRLVMTESAYFSSISQKNCFNELNVKRYKIVATLDSNTSSICQGLDGEIFNMKDYEAGVSAPPFHPQCRTTTVPHFDDNYGERAARKADGTTHYVSSDMKYKDWKEKYVSE